MNSKLSLIKFFRNTVGRQVNGFPVFGTGQTTEEGFLKVLDKVKAIHGEGDGENLLWFNMRKVTRHGQLIIL